MQEFDQLFGDKIDPITGKADPDKSVLVNRAVQGHTTWVRRSSRSSPWRRCTARVLAHPRWPTKTTGSYKLESVADDVCATGVRCKFKQRQQHPHQPSRPPYGPVSVADGSRRQ